MPWLLILHILKKFWIPIVVGISLISTYIYAHHKGYSDCEDKMNAIIVEEQQQYQESMAEAYQQIQALEAALYAKPTLTDKEASCLLSGDPIEGGCI